MLETKQLTVAIDFHIMGKKKNYSSQWLPSTIWLPRYKIYKIFDKHILCSVKERNSYRFGTSGGWVFLLFWANYPFNKNSSSLSMVLKWHWKPCMVTFLLLGFLVADREADRDAGVEDVAVAVTAVTQQSVQSVRVLLQQHGLLQIDQVLPARLVITAQHVLHQRLLLKRRGQTIHQPETQAFHLHWRLKHVQTGKCV